jgi:hypothetical protein
MVTRRKPKPTENKALPGPTENKAAAPDAPQTADTPTDAPTFGGFGFPPRPAAPKEG